MFLMFTRYDLSTEDKSSVIVGVREIERVTPFEGDKNKSKIYFRRSGEFIVVTETVAQVFLAITRCKKS